MQGYIYAFEANDIQNGWTTQMQAVVNDYPERVIGQVLFNERGSRFTSTVVAHPFYEKNEAGLAVGAHLNGQGLFTLGTSPAVMSYFHVHVYKSLTGAWIQAEVYGVDGALLWGTGTVWPAPASVPIKLPSLQIILPR